MNNIQAKKVNNTIESKAKWIIADDIQSLLDANLEAIKTCNQREKQYLLAQNEAYQKSIDVIVKYIIDRFEL